MSDTLTDVVKRIQPLAELLAAPRPAIDIPVAASLRSISQSDLGAENSSSTRPSAFLCSAHVPAN